MIVADIVDCCCHFRPDLHRLVAARITKQPVEAMGWLNTFIIYAALPALFFKLVSKTPLEELARMDFVAASLACTYGVFLLVFLISRFVRKNSLPKPRSRALRRATAISVIWGRASRFWR